MPLPQKHWPILRVLPQSVPSYKLNGISLFVKDDESFFCLAQRRRWGLVRKYDLTVQISPRSPFTEGGGQVLAIVPMPQIGREETGLRKGCKKTSDGKIENF